jgi:hypothetical protein
MVKSVLVGGRQQRLKVMSDARPQKNSKIDGYLAPS